MNFDLQEVLRQRPDVRLHVVDAQEIVRNGVHGDVFCNAHGEVYPVEIEDRLFEFFEAGRGLAAPRRRPVSDGNETQRRKVDRGRRTVRGADHAPQARTAGPKKEPFDLFRARIGMMTYVPPYPLEQASRLLQRFDPALVGSPETTVAIPRVGITVCSTIPMHAVDAKYFGPILDGLSGQARLPGDALCGLARRARRLADPHFAGAGEELGKPLPARTVDADAALGDLHRPGRRPTSPGPAGRDDRAGSPARCACGRSICPWPQRGAGKRSSRQANWSGGCRGLARARPPRRGRAWTISRPATDSLDGRRRQASRQHGRHRITDDADVFLRPVRFEIIDDKGRVRDYAESAVVPWRPEKLRAGPKLAVDGRYFDYRDGSLAAPACFLVGANWQDRVQYGFTWHNPNGLRRGAATP